MQSIHSSKLWKMSWIAHQMIERKKQQRGSMPMFTNSIWNTFFCLSLIIVIGLVYSMYTVNSYYAQLLTVIFMLILMVSPSLNPKSSSCFGAAFSWSIFSWFFTHLKWSWSATFKSNESDRSPNPRPKNAVRPGTKKNMICWYCFENVIYRSISYHTIQMICKMNAWHYEIWPSYW